MMLKTIITNVEALKITGNKGMNLIELQNMIYKQNCELGWHDGPRSFNTFICLFHSELSEALEGDRKGLMDDHLPQYPMCAVEIADFVIRVLDWFGSIGIGDTEAHRLDIDAKDNVDYIAMLHMYTATAGDCMNNCSTEKLERAIGICIDMAEVNKWPLEQIILEKVAYNKTRADHKRENRAKEGGKKY